MSKIWFILLLFPTISYSQKKERKDSESYVLFKLGVKFFNEENYLAADSCFSKSIELEPFYEDSYYNLALVKLKQKKNHEYCLNLEMAKRFGDKEAKKLFECNCLVVDSFLVDSNNKAANILTYSHKIRFTNYKYNTNRKVEVFDIMNELELDYMIHNEDTIYFALPEKDFPKSRIHTFTKEVRAKVCESKFIKNGHFRGSMFVMFDVDKGGNISNIIPTSWYHRDLYTEVQKVLNLISNFGVVNYMGKPVKSRIEIKIKI